MSTPVPGSRRPGAVRLGTTRDGPRCALRDCLRDLHWMAATRFLVVIDDAVAVLSEAPDEREILLRALDDAVTFWAGRPGLPGQERSSFEVVLPGPPAAGSHH
ncbi:barstar family protein [Streptomyces sp. NPDC055966]|uniref:barstar family protein n=1 Tax=Streptomyces sp. NPDC055966 TaxID=3345669 RepID=UPI0035D72553